MTPVTPANNVNGYAEAVARETIIRDAAFLGQPENAAGFELRQMTLRDYLLLKLTACPLLWGGAPSPLELSTFLWAMSTSYPYGQRKFLQRCRKTFVPPSLPWLRLPSLMRRWERKVELSLAQGAKVLEAAHEYMDETMQDRPRNKKKGEAKSYYSSACYWWGTLSRNGYSMTREQVLDTPLKILFQCMSEIREEKGLALFNPSDNKVANDREAQLAKLNAGLKK